MNCYSCDHNNLTKDYIFESEFWRIYLNEEQSFLGRCVVVAKRHTISLPELTTQEWYDLKEVIKKLEASTTKAFGARMHNWSCLMNDAYQENSPNPHVHWHLRPRYDKTIDFSGKVFDDPDFGHHYSRDRREKADEATRQEIITAIKQNL